MLAANIPEKGQGVAQVPPPVSSSHEINVHRAEPESFRTPSPDIGAVADIGVQAAMEFLTTDKVVDFNERPDTNKNKVTL